MVSYSVSFDTVGSLPLAKMHCIQLLVMHATLFLPVNICGRHSGVAYIGQTTDDNDAAHAYKLKRALE